MEIILVGMVLMFVIVAFFIFAEFIMAAFFRLLLVITIPISALFDGADVVKEKLEKIKVKKIKKDPRDGSIVVRVSKSDLSNSPINRPTVWRRKR